MSSYDDKIIAHYGYIDSGEILWQYLNSLAPNELIAWYLIDNLRDDVANILGISRMPKEHEDLRAASVVMNRFYLVVDDCLVPIDS